jgi:hypothetical protein
MAPISNFPEFDAQLERARVGMNQLLNTYPGDSFLESIARQLGFVHEWTRGGKRPTGEQLKKLSFGVMASRAVDELNPDLAQTLYRLANFLDNWA